MSEFCGFTVMDAEGEEQPCDRPASGWRWYQGHDHEDLLDAACWEHENEGGRRMHAAEAKVAAVLAECDGVPNSQTPLWPSAIRLAIEEAS